MRCPLVSAEDYLRCVSVPWRFWPHFYCAPGERPPRRSPTPAAWSSWQMLPHPCSTTRTKLATTASHGVDGTPLPPCFQNTSPGPLNACASQTKGYCHGLPKPRHYPARLLSARHSMRHWKADGGPVPCRWPPSSSSAMAARPPPTVRSSRPLDTRVPLKFLSPPWQ